MARIPRLLRLALYSSLLLALLGAAGLGVLYWLVVPRLPDVQTLREVELQVPMSVYTRDERLIAQFGEFRRYPVRIDEVPEPVKHAFIAIEDARFYQHHGLDWRGITRAIWLLATTDDRRVPGGSTITQQVARQFFLSSEYSYSRKFAEMLLALKMERELSKDEILELYLNKSFFGNRAYGVAAAAEFYYGKRLDQLTLDEAATLASIPKFPSSGNPIVNPDRALVRRDYVLQRMREVGFISADQLRAAQAAPMHAEPHEPPVEVDAPYVAEMVRQAITDRYGSDALNQGLRVYTTIDSVAQHTAVRALRDGLLAYDRRHGWRGAEAHLDLTENEDPAQLRRRLREYPEIGGLLPALVTATTAEEARLLLADGRELALSAEAIRWTGRKPAALLKRGDVIRLTAGAEEGTLILAQIPKAQSALVSLEPEDGALRALVGGFSFALNKFNRATQAQRQPGSSFKPFVYTAAFERGFTPASIVLDAPVVFHDRWTGKTWRPQNDTENFAGPMRLREAMVQSRNLVSVRLLDTIGVDYARRFITNFGFSEQSLPPNLSMALGTASVPPMTMARGYAVIANGGYLVEPWFIDRVVDRDGVTIAREHPLRACAECPERAARDTRSQTVVDGFDLGPAASTERRAVVPLPEDFVGPPDMFLAPHTIDERTTFLVRSLMRDVIKRGTGRAALVLERDDIGGKTGSTNEHRDAWFSGFGTGVVTSVWVGMDDFSSLGYKEYGGRAALPIWIDYMRVALKEVPPAEPQLPAGIVTASVNAGTGSLSAPGTPGTIEEYFKSEDLDRILASGYASDVTASEQEAFDIF